MSRVRANTIMDQAATGAPDFPYGFTATSGSVSGLLTATTYDITNLNITGVATVAGTTASESTTTGAITISGGAGIAKSCYVGGNLDVAGSLAVGGTITYDDIHNLDSIGVVTARTGIEVTAGGVSINGGGLDIVGLTTGLSVAGVSTFANSITVSGGGIDVTGGIALSGAGVLTIADTTQSTSKDTGSIITNGGVGIEKNLNVGTAVTISGAGIATFSQGMKVGGGNALQEKCHIESQAWSRPNAGDNDINLDYGMVQLVTGDVLAGTGNTLNVTSSVGINTSMVTGDIIAVTGITSVNASTAFVNTLQIDHTTVEVAWVGGSAPTSGGSSGYDIYAFNIIKTANAKYAVIGNHVKTS